MDKSKKHKIVYKEQKHHHKMQVSLEYVFVEVLSLKTLETFKKQSKNSIKPKENKHTLMKV